MRVKRSFTIERAVLSPKTRRVALPETAPTLKTARRRDRFAKALAAIEFRRKRS